MSLTCSLRQCCTCFEVDFFKLSCFFFHVSHFCNEFFFYMSSLINNALAVIQMQIAMNKVING